MQLKTESCFLNAHPSQGHVELKHADKEALRQRLRQRLLFL